jgi:2-polyprenyl-3-methyl-5-hydroxy-6-metoxy-1,4-benzoquinol methylase
LYLVPEKEKPSSSPIHDTGERMLPTQEGEVSIVFARHTLTYEYALQYAEGKKALDAGCGTGYGSNMLATRAHHVTAIDLSGDALDYCRSHYAKPNLEFVQKDVTKLTYRGEFDVAVSFQVIEHLPDPSAFLQSLKQAVVPGGTILIATPNVRTPRTGADANPFHCSEMSFDELRALLSKHFSSFQVLGIGHARPNALRAFIYKTPLYRLGKLLKRGSAVKRLANKTLNLTNFQIISERVAEDAADLIAVCKKEN